MKKIIFFIILFLINFVGSVNYNEGSYGLGIFGVGEGGVPPSGGGGGRDCTYDWDCTDWSPQRCNADGTQTRICINRGTCRGELFKPEETRNCTYQGPLFDIFLNIDDNSREICSGDKVKSKVQMINYGDAELHDAFMTYWIVDRNNTLISEVKETRAVQKNLDFEISINTPFNVVDGDYYLYAKMIYGNNQVALAGDSFRVNQEKCTIFSEIRYYFAMAIFGLVVAIISVSILVVLIVLRRRLKIIHEKVSDY